MSNDLANIIAEELAAYSKEVTDEVNKIAEEVTEETVQELRSNSPVRKGKYAKGWTKKKLANGSYVVYNRVHQLTHLLENGYIKRNGGRVSGIVHIKPAEENAIAKFQERIQEIGK